MVINSKTEICGLIGYPVGHSVSPVIHNSLADMYGQNLVYVPLETEPRRLADAIKGAEAFGFSGMNVTVPYKRDVIPLLKEIDPLAERIGAVNTLVRTEGGFKGYNTDMPGLYRALCADRVEIEGENAILIGAGGVARAAAFLMLEKGASHLIILNRSLKHGEQLAAEINRQAGRGFATALPIEAYKILDDSRQYIVIQATNVGMHPDTGHAVIEDEAFYRFVKVGYDMIFNPPETKFMQLMKAAGGRAYNGLKMLLYQAVIAYELWTGTQVSEETAKKIYPKLEEALGLR